MLIPYIKLSVSVTSISHHALPKSGELDIALVYTMFILNIALTGGQN